jgi:hypothetical protein
MKGVLTGMGKSSGSYHLAEQNFPCAESQTLDVSEELAFQAKPLPRSAFDWD